jgi:hypothetical protein
MRVDLLIALRYDSTGRIIGPGRLKAGGGFRESHSLSSLLIVSFPRLCETSRFSGGR